MELKRSEQGFVSGSEKADLELPKNITGNITVDWDGQNITGGGKVGYSGDKLSEA